jgi:hypothetical protein
MKTRTIVIVMLASILSVYAIANTVFIHPEKYCAKMKDGKMVVMHQGSAIMTDVRLDDGTMVKMDGTIIRTDSSKSKLKVGECISKDGMVAKEMKKTKNSK